MIQMFRKKPVVVEAMLFDGSNESMDDIREWANKEHKSTAFIGDGVFAIKTLEGIMSVSDGDWIIRGIQGEFYPCKPDIFEATYEAIGKEKQPSMADDFLDEMLNIDEPRNES